MYHYIPAHVVFGRVFGLIVRRRRRRFHAPIYIYCYYPDPRGLSFPANANTYTHYPCTLVERATVSYLTAAGGNELQPQVIADLWRYGAAMDNAPPPHTYIRHTHVMMVIIL